MVNVRGASEVDIAAAWISRPVSHRVVSEVAATGAALVAADGQAIMVCSEWPGFVVLHFWPKGAG